MQLRGTAEEIGLDSRALASGLEMKFLQDFAFLQGNFAFDKTYETSGTTASFRLLRLATMFTTMNLALLVGFWRWASGGQRGVWQRTARQA